MQHHCWNMQLNFRWNWKTKTKDNVVAEIRNIAAGTCSCTPTNKICMYMYICLHLCHICKYIFVECISIRIIQTPVHVSALICAYFSAIPQMVDTPPARLRAAVYDGTQPPHPGAEHCNATASIECSAHASGSPHKAGSIWPLPFALPSHMCCWEPGRLWTNDFANLPSCFGGRGPSNGQSGKRSARLHSWCCH